ncbi:MAG: hypothetical protein IPK60_02420 [Sandaracinaceae bacterium]|nr:hypothetical protein [Sandaracinaceae bacterium]
MNQNSEKNTTSLDESLRALTTVGLAWARHGLTIARSATYASATTLHSVANMLGEISTRLDKDLAEKSNKSAD